MTNHEIKMAIINQQGKSGKKLVNEFLRTTNCYRSIFMEPIWKPAFDHKGPNDNTYLHDAFAVCFGKII